MTVDSFTPVLQPTEAPPPRLVCMRIPPLCEYTHTGSHRVCMQTHAQTHMRQSFLSSPLSSIFNKASFQCPAPAARGGIQPRRHYLTVKEREKKGRRRLKTDPRLTNELKTAGTDTRQSYCTRKFVENTPRGSLIYLWPEGKELALKCVKTHTHTHTNESKLWT